MNVPVTSESPVDGVMDADGVVRYGDARFFRGDDGGWQWNTSWPAVGGGRSVRCGVVSPDLIRVSGPPDPDFAAVLDHHHPLPEPAKAVTVGTEEYRWADGDLSWELLGTSNPADRRDWILGGSTFGQALDRIWQLENP